MWPCLAERHGLCKVPEYRVSLGTGHLLGQSGLCWMAAGHEGWGGQWAQLLGAAAAAAMSDPHLSVFLGPWEALEALQGQLEAASRRLAGSATRAAHSWDASEARSRLDGVCFQPRLTTARAQRTGCSCARPRLRFRLPVCLACASHLVCEFGPVLEVSLGHARSGAGHLTSDRALEDGDQAGVLCSQCAPPHPGLCGGIELRSLCSLVKTPVSPVHR